MKKFKKPTVKKLKQEYAIKINKIMTINNLNQTELGTLLNTSGYNLSRWINEIYLPNSEFREKIDKLFQETIIEEGKIKNGKI